MTQIDGGAFTDVAGLEVGHFTHTERPTGCTVILARDGAVAGVDVRGAAPGTRETDLLEAGNLVDQVHAIVLSGGSAFGLESASGVMRWLVERSIGLNTGYGVVPIVPAAVLFDLPMQVKHGAALSFPNANSGYQACEAASATRCTEGNVGAGAGATVGKLFGLDRCMKGGIGQASVRVGNVVVSALMACNAIGDVLELNSGRILAGARSADHLQWMNTQASLLSGSKSTRPLPGTNTTIGVVACNLTLTKAQAKRLAISAHDGLARTIRPVHTSLDGDTVFAMATGTCDETADLLLLNTMAAHASAVAIQRAVTQAQGVQTVLGYLPSANEFHPKSSATEY
jgi:L-aminopeptidase/D-esterase-like protein